eukprot:TRINITY_DN1622_c0_g1_i1.p1 TRINITY_DN1622_c0_g1~~TRINITY_DN1622_c0_g1_i1.p1  ORF type:complete len:473 (+),score=71.92 TRINITY_DN1622_c0_g1_i1:111-1529(+)
MSSSGRAPPRYRLFHHPSDGSLLKTTGSSFLTTDTSQTDLTPGSNLLSKSASGLLITEQVHNGTDLQKNRPRSHTTSVISSISETSLSSDRNRDSDSKSSGKGSPHPQRRNPSFIEVASGNPLLPSTPWDQEIYAILNYTPPLDQFPNHRDKVARELFTSESTYVRNLRFVVREYMKPMEDLLQQNDISVIFSHIRPLLNVNETLLRELYIKIKDWTQETTLSDALQYLIPFLKMYTNYVAGFDYSLKKLAEIQRNSPRVVHALSEIRKKDGSCGLDLQSFLIMPVQRIPRYTLLLEDILKHTESNHPDHPGLVQALKQVREVATKVNDAIREQENRNRILDIHIQFGGEVQVIDPHRKFIRRGVLTKICRKDERQRHFLLFSDMLMYAQPSGESGLKLCRKINMEDLAVANYIEQQGEETNCFIISSLKKSFLVRADTLAEKEGWLNELKKQIDQHRRIMIDKLGRVFELT